MIALDQRGHGRSSTFTHPARCGTAMADDVVRLLDRLHVRRAHLVGHSMGALVAANIAARYPERVASAALVAAPLYADSAAAAGTGDPLLVNGRALAARWPGARLLEVPGADHAGVIARPEVLAAMRALLRQPSAPGTH